MDRYTVGATDEAPHRLHSPAEDPDVACVNLPRPSSRTRTSFSAFRLLTFGLVMVFVLTGANFGVAFPFLDPPDPWPACRQTVLKMALAGDPDLSLVLTPDVCHRLDEKLKQVVPGDDLWEQRSWTNHLTRQLNFMADRVNELDTEIEFPSGHPLQKLFTIRNQFFENASLAAANRFLELDIDQAREHLGKIYDMLIMNIEWFNGHNFGDLIPEKCSPIPETVPAPPPFPPSESPPISPAISASSLFGFIPSGVPNSRTTCSASGPPSTQPPKQTFRDNFLEIDLKEGLNLSNVLTPELCDQCNEKLDRIMPNNHTGQEIRNGLRTFSKTVNCLREHYRPELRQQFIERFVRVAANRFWKRTLIRLGNTWPHFQRNCQRLWSGGAGA